MLPTLKRILWMMLLASGLQTSWAFSLLGPVAVGDDAWQVEAIGYNPIPGNSGAPPFFIDPLAVGPKNLGAEYRRNTPVMFYTCDANFLDYFGSNGSAAVDQAFAILNDVGRTNISSYRKDLSEFSLNTVVVNYQAQALLLRDLKSQTLALMTEQLGLTDSVRYVWALHNRFIPPGATCPVVDYQVIMRNFDFMTSPLNQLQYSPYINGSLFSYFIYEICSAPAAPPNADALDFSVDPLVNNPPVASLNEDGLQLGAFFTGLTRDDVAGLRYLISSNNFNTETLSAGSTQVAGGGGTITNNADAFALTTSNLTDLVFALTNNPTALQALYPGLVIAAVRTNFNGTFTYTFANLVTNTFFNTTTIQIQVQAVVTNPPPVGSPFGSGTVATNATTTTLTTNLPSGDFFLIPTNLCGLNVIGVLATNVIATTNSVGTPGTFPFTNVIIFSTNHVLLVAPCEFIISGGGGTNANTGLFQGMEKFQFVRANFDSLLSQFFQPVTNFYQTVVVINDQAVVQSWQRVVTTPDVLFTAADILPGPAAQNSIVEPFNRTLGFDQANARPGLAGPGVITNSSTITYNKVGPVFLNLGPASLTLPSAIKGFIWGSFDETTNDPVVYPNGTSIENLANQVLIQISPPSLLNGVNGSPYSFVYTNSTGIVYTNTFTATGGSFQPPFTWSATGLPLGLTMTTVNGNGYLGNATGTGSGTPAQAGTFDFIIKLTDSLGRSVTWSYSITIH